MVFHERLRELRAESPYTQKQLAKMLGVVETAYQMYEYGTRAPNIEKLLQLAVIFDVSLDDLLCLEDYRRSLAEREE